ncbi:MAG TPA: hypothetical protein VE685_24970 [Thermoanaerobaculia bacterium]|nr:hypothetical protein [Thermoanaerobaculia bacterium]
MMSRKFFWTGTLTVAAAGLLTGALIADHLLHRPVRTTRAAWKEVYKAPGELVHRVDAIVLATAVDVQPGRIATSDNEEDVLRFQLVSFDVLRGLKGVDDGERITLERAVASNGGILLDFDGGDFEMGQHYLLFLKRQEDGSPYFYQVNDQGRFRIANDRLVAVARDDKVAAHFDQRTVREALALVRTNLRAQSPRVQ